MTRAADRGRSAGRHASGADGDTSGADGDASGTDGDTSGADGDASGTDGDTSGADGDASGRRFAGRVTPKDARRLPAPRTRNPRVSPLILDARTAHGGALDGRARRAAKGPPALLDSSPPLPSSQASPEGEGAPWVLVSLLWPVLWACRGAALSLWSVTLTAPRRVDVRAAAASLATWIEAQPGAGAVLVQDRRPKDGTAHLHGLALVHDAAALGKRWRTLTDAGAACVRLNPMTGWPEHLHGESIELLGEVGKVIRYAFRLCPAQRCWRDLDRDVFAAGVLSGPWTDARAAARGALDVNLGARVCAWCRQGMPPSKRRDAQWCRPACRKHASRARGTPKASSDGPV
jgi:hypothetical protein